MYMLCSGVHASISKYNMFKCGVFSENMENCQISKMYMAEVCMCLIDFLKTNFYERTSILLYYDECNVI